MSISVNIKGLEEKQHPFYVIKYQLLEDDTEVLDSVARYVHTDQGGKVQFLEPDMRKLQANKNYQQQIDQLEQQLKAEGNRLAE